MSEYKFDCRKLAAVKRTPKHKRDLIGGVKKALIKGYKESTLWDILALDVSHVGVETSTVIARMNLTR